jgi:hypothetical protein
VKLAAPTTFEFVIREAARQAAPYASGEPQRYFVLLILTDGVITQGHGTTYVQVPADQSFNRCSSSLSLFFFWISAHRFV